MLVLATSTGDTPRSNVGVLVATSGRRSALLTFGLDRYESNAFCVSQHFNSTKESSRNVIMKQRERERERESRTRRKRI
jgi:hypothetical protein